MQTRSLRDAPQAETFVESALPWVHEAGKPYFDWLLGGKVQARQVLSTWMRRASSEVWIERATVLLDGRHVVGGFIALAPTELAECRKADLLALLQRRSHYSGIAARLGMTRSLFPPIGHDDFYLSKLGVVPESRGSGLGRLLLSQFLTLGHQHGFRRFRLDVSSRNERAIRLYQSAGFRVTGQGASTDRQIEYLAMELEG